VRESRALSRGKLDALLDSAFRIRPGEAERVGLMFVYLMGVVSMFIVGRTVRDTLFLSRYDLSNLPYMYVAVAVFVALASYGYSRVVNRYRRDRLVLATLLFFTVVITGFWGLLRAGLAVGGFYPTLYVLVEIIGTISIIQFWTFANDIYSSREAKRLFGVIGAGGVLSNIICGFVIGSLAPRVGSENLLLGCAALLAVCAACVNRLGRVARTELEHAGKKPSKKIGLTKDSGTVLSSRHLQLIAGIVIFTFLTVTIIDYQFKLVAKHSFDEAGLATYFGFFYGCCGLISSVVQFFFTSRILERGGIVVSLAILPVSLIFGAGSLLLVPMVSALAAVSIAKGAENIFRYTVNDATTQLLYVPVPSHQRGRAKAFIDGILKPAAQAVAGIVLVVFGRSLAATDQAVMSLAWLDLALIGAWIALVIAIRREYLSSLISTLHARRLDLNGPWTPITDDATVKMLKRSLFSTGEERVLHALELVPTVDADFGTELCALLQHPSNRVRISALKLIGNTGRYDHVHSIHALLSDSDQEVRAAAISAFCAIGRERAIRSATPFLTDKSVAVRGAAVAALIKHGGLDGILTAAEALKALLKSPEPLWRLHGAHVLAEIKVRNFFHPLLELLQDPDVRVRIAAVDAAAAMQSPELVPSLVYKLAHPDTAEAAVRALAAYGTGVERTLFRVLENKEENIVIRRKVPKILSRIGEQGAVDHLIANLDSRDPELRVAIAKAASKIRDRSPRVKVDDLILDREIRSEIREAYQSLAIIEDLALPRRDLLPEALAVRHQVRLGLAFRLLAVRYPAKTIQLVYSNLDSESKAMRANALEVVDNVLSKDESRLLLPLLEDITPAEKVQRGSELFPVERHTSDEWLSILLDDSHPWIVSCTLYLIGERKLSALEERVVKHLKSRDPIVRESACFTLAQILADAPRENGALQKIVNEVAADSVAEVRRASTSLMALLSPAS
jgi:ATP/ADP translocase/HEAT repeat protein